LFVVHRLDQKRYKYEHNTTLPIINMAHHHSKNSASITEGTTEPSDHAYVDAFLHPIGINRNNVSVSCVQEQRFEDDEHGGSSYTIFHHELLYKRDVCWRLETKCQGDRHYSSKCNVVKGQLVIKTFPTKKKWFGKSRKKMTREYDVAAIIRGAAVAYHSDAAEEELGLINGEIDPLLTFQILDSDEEISTYDDTRDDSSTGWDLESRKRAESVRDGIEEESANLREEDAMTRDGCSTIDRSYKFPHCYVVDKEDSLINRIQEAKHRKYDGGLGGLTCI
jgi:hypothetical protein